MPDLIARHTLPDLFDRTFRVIAATWRTTLPVLVVSGIVYGFGQWFALDRYFAQIGNLVATGKAGVIGDLDGALSLMREIGNLYAILGLMVALMTVVNAFSESACMLAAWKAAKGEEVSPETVLGPALKTYFLPMLLQNLVISFALSMGLSVLVFVLLVPVVAIGAAVALSGANTLAVSVVASVLFTLLLVAVYGVAMIATQFSGPLVVVEGKPSIEAIKASVALARAKPWRVIGITVLVYLAVSFAVGLVTLPLSWFLAAPALGALRDSAATADYSALRAAFSSVMFPYTVVAFLTMVLQYLFMGPFKVLFAIDLKFRRGDFTPIQEDPSEANEVTGTPEVGGSPVGDLGDGLPDGYNDGNRE
jgi:hypothetical protein